MVPPSSSFGSVLTVGLTDNLSHPFGQKGRGIPGPTLMHYGTVPICSRGRGKARENIQRERNISNRTVWNVEGCKARDVRLCGEEIATFEHN